MEIKEIIEELENLKCNIWEYCDWEKTYTQIQVKKTTNLLLDLLEQLDDEVNDNAK